MDDEQRVKEQHSVASISEGHETTCWGCGFHLLLETYSPIFKCGWCGAITNRNKALRKPDSVCFSHWRLVRDRFFVTILLFFMLFVISAGVWAVYPVIFSISYFCGIFHSTLTAVLSISTITSFCLAASRSAGAPPNILWGSYPVVAKGDLESYTFCGYCSNPKPPRAHHCRSCRMCVLDMDHHCPFIGNCVGAANHRFFIAFLISVIISCTYVVVMTLYAGFHTWPPLEFRKLSSTGYHSVSGLNLAKDFIASLASSALLLSARGLVLIYLAFACLSVGTGLSVLLWQQLYYIYEGNTYINRLNSENVWHGERGFQNLLRFFGCPYSVFKVLLGPANAGKFQDTSGSKLL